MWPVVGRQSLKAQDSFRIADNTPGTLLAAYRVCLASPPRDLLTARSAGLTQDDLRVILHIGNDQESLGRRATISSGSRNESL